MANVLFTRAPLSEIENTQTTPYPVTDGQLLFDTSGSGKMYMDVGTQRLEMGGAMTIDSKLNSTSTNPIQNKAVGGVMLSTLDEINAATSKGFITDALATRALAQKIGTTDISSIGDGTCTGAISALNASIEHGTYAYPSTVSTKKDINISIDFKNKHNTPPSSVLLSYRTFGYFYGELHLLDIAPTSTGFRCIYLPKEIGNGLGMLIVDWVAFWD